jgi:TonB family protein
MVRQWNNLEGETDGQTTPRRRAARPKDNVEKRLFWGGAISVGVHVAALAVFGVLLRVFPGLLGHDHVNRPHGPVEMTLEPRLVYAKEKPRPTPSPTPSPAPTPNPTPSPVATTLPLVAPVVRTTPSVRPTPAPQPVRVAARPRVVPNTPTTEVRSSAPSTGPRNRVLTALPDSAAPAGARTFAMPAGGNADAGQVMASQGDGVAAVPSSGPPTSGARRLAGDDSAPTAAAALPKATEEPETPKPVPTPVPTPAPPRPTGPTRNAEASFAPDPTIPDSLKQGEFKSFVRVRVEIAADGTFDVALRTTSGNPEVDQRVLEALKRWKWKPALKNGTPTASVQAFKYEIEVN